MRHRTRIKPSKTASVIGFIIGTAFVILGLLVVFPSSSTAGFGIFGIIGILAAAAIAVYYGVNLFSGRGVL